MPDLKGFHRSNTAQENEEEGNIKMPVRKVKGGFKWGKSGKVSRLKKRQKPKAERSTLLVTKRMARKRKRKSAKKKPVPTNPTLYARVKAEAKRKFKVYPSAYANGWLVRTYKARGGKYRMGVSRRKKR